MGNKRHWSELEHLKGLCKEKNIHTCGPLPLGVSRPSHNLGILVLRSCMEEMGALSCWKIH